MKSSTKKENTLSLREEAAREKENAGWLRRVKNQRRGRNWEEGSDRIVPAGLIQIFLPQGGKEGRSKKQPGKGKTGEQSRVSGRHNRMSPVNPHPRKEGKYLPPAAREKGVGRGTPGRGGHQERSRRPAIIRNSASDAAVYTRPMWQGGEDYLRKVISPPPYREEGEGTTDHREEGKKN